MHEAVKIPPTSASDAPSAATPCSPPPVRALRSAASRPISGGGSASGRARTHIRTYAHTHIRTYAHTHIRTYARCMDWHHMRRPPTHTCQQAAARTVGHVPARPRASRRRHPKPDAQRPVAAPLGARARCLPLFLCFVFFSSRCAGYVTAARGTAVARHGGAGRPRPLARTTGGPSTPPKSPGGTARRGHGRRHRPRGRSSMAGRGADGAAAPACPAAGSTTGAGADRADSARGGGWPPRRAAPPARAPTRRRARPSRGRRRHCRRRHACQRPGGNSCQRAGSSHPTGSSTNAKKTVAATRGRKN